MQPHLQNKPTMGYGKKRRKGIEEEEEEEEDVLSSLPDDIIANILSLLPIKNAVATAALARRWRAAWTQMNYLNINIDITHPHLSRPYSLSFLQHHVLPKLTTKNVSICFRDRYTNNNLAGIEPWLRQLCDWHFQDIHFKNEAYGTTQNLFSLGLLNGISNHLRSLKLDHVKAPLDSSTVFPNLTYLGLNWDSYHCQEVEYLLYASPVLEVLVLKLSNFGGFVTGTSAAACKLTHLKRVELHISEPICFGKAEHVLNFFKFLLTAAPLLERIIFKYTSQLSRRGLKERLFRKEIQAFPTCCPRFKIEYVGRYNKLLGLGTQNVLFW